MTLGDYGGEHSAFRAVDLVHAVAFPHRPALMSARQIEIPCGHISGIAIIQRIAFAVAATAAADPIAIAAVAVISGSGIVSIPHDDYSAETAGVALD